MKKDSLIIPLLISTFTILVNSQDLSQEGYNRYVGSSTYTFKSGGHGQLIMEKISGDVTINGDPINKVEIIEIITIRANSEKKAKELFEKARAIVRKTSNNNEELAIVVSGPAGISKRLSYNYKVRIPMVFSIAVDTRGGDIELADIKGQIDVSTAGGDLDLTDLSGRISAETSGGDVDVEHLNGRIFLNTSGGDIEVETIKGDLNAKTSGGDIIVDNVKGSVSVRTSGGDIGLSDIDGRDIFAKTNGGDIVAENIFGRVDLTTSGGSIEMEHIRGEIDASTSAGDIDLEEIWGSASVWTSAGNIEGNDIFGALDARTSVGDIDIVKLWDKDLEDHDIKLRTSGGDINLTLPRNFPGDFSARSMSAGVKASNSIQSEFELYITATSSYSRAKGKIGEGIFQVDLESNMGTITIYKED